MLRAPWFAFQLLALPRFGAQTCEMILMKMYRGRVSISAVPAVPQVISWGTELLLLLPRLPGSGQETRVVVMGMPRVSTSGLPLPPEHRRSCKGVGKAPPSPSAFPGVFLSHSFIHAGIKWPNNRVLFSPALLRETLKLLGKWSLILSLT